MRLPFLLRVLVPCCTTVLAFPALVSAQVPLKLWKTPKNPNGVALGRPGGTTVGDFDQDGWVDLCVLDSGQLWRNEQGKDFVFAADLRKALPPATARYGAHFGDYDNDGMPDLGIASYLYLGGDDCFRILRNLGNAKFLDVTRAANAGPFCTMHCETISWADVDGDGNLDVFVPSYPWNNTTWSVFLRNQGPTGANGSYQFKEMTKASGLDVLFSHPRPEGAQFCDFDSDGDLDLFSNTVVYHNVTQASGSPRFEKWTRIPNASVSTFDEGALFFDYDLDGDFDLLVANISPAIGVKLFENRGDGTLVDVSVIPSPAAGVGLGLSVGDWDNDGDLDINTRQYFRKNLIVETGKPGFQLVTHALPPGHISSATICWADLDKDGDVDAFIGNYWSVSNLYQNTTYTATTPESKKHHVRVRVVRDSPTLARGLETEYGASVEIRVAGDSYHHRQHTASGAGYINQNEYTLNFALPARIPVEQTYFDVSVDYPSLPSQGYWRVDKRVNPVLGNLRLSELRGARDIVVYRSGKVTINGEMFPAPSGVSPRLTTTTGGLVLTSASGNPAAPKSEPAGTWVGIAFDTFAALRPQRMTEVILDGETTAVTVCGAAVFNIALWDVTSKGAEQLVATTVARTSARNDRSYIPVDFTLLPGRTYRLLAGVLRSRATPIAGASQHGGVRVAGGLRLTPASPCSGSAVAAAPVDAKNVYLAFRFASDTPVEWMDLGLGLAGSAGVPRLGASGRMAGGASVSFNLTGARPSSAGALVLGLSPALFPFLGGTLVPSTDYVLLQVATDAQGRMRVGGKWPAGVAANVSLYLQAWIVDPGAPFGAAASNGLLGVTR